MSLGSNDEIGGQVAGAHIIDIAQNAKSLDCLCPVLMEIAARRQLLLHAHALEASGLRLRTRAAGQEQHHYQPSFFHHHGSLRIYCAGLR